MQVKETGVSNSMSFFLCYSSNLHAAVYKRTAGRRIAAVFVGGFFFFSLLQTDPEVSPPLPCSQYTGFEACRMQTSFIPAWYCTDCFFACHLRSLTSHRPHTFSHPKARTSSSPWLWAWIENREWEFYQPQMGWLVNLWYLITMNCLGGEGGRGTSTNQSNT